jgi:hypothetical protein
MLTISISEALQGPAAWPELEWGSSDAEALAAAKAWQQQVSGAQWDFEAEDPLADNKFALGQLDMNLGEAWRQAEHDPALWSPWMANAWGQSHEAAGLPARADAPEAAASLALAASTLAGAHAVDEAAAKVSATNEAAFASPLRVPLPEPLAVEPMSSVELGLELELLGLTEDVDEEPQKVSAPPGLKPQSGPGPFLGACQSPAAAAAASGPLQKPTAVRLGAAQIADHAPAGMAINPAEVEGQACSRIDWKIDDFSGKLQASMGRPVVSPAFAACGLSNLRLMVFPDARDAVKSARSHERKGLYAAMVKKGPLYGSLKLKADGLECSTVMTFALVVGNVRVGPKVYDFSEQAVQGVDDFDVDWLQQVDKGTGALRVSIEVVEVRRK